MKLLVNVAITAAVLMTSAAIAQATPLLSVGLQESGVNSGNITTEGTSSSSSIVVGSINYGTFDVNLVTGLASTMPTSLFSNSINDSTSTAGTLTVYLTEQGVTSPTGATNWLSSFTTNQLPAGWTVVQSTYYDNANGVFSTASAIDSATLTTSNSTASSTDPSVLSATYSITEKYVITSTGSGASNSTIDLTAQAVPEPGTLALLGAGLVGLGFIRRRGASFRR